MFVLAYNAGVLLSKKSRMPLCAHGAQSPYVTNKINLHGRFRFHAARMPGVVYCARTDIR